MIQQQQRENNDTRKEVQNEFWSYGEFELVGHGKQTNANCGRFVSFKGCLHTELHNKTTLDGVNYKARYLSAKFMQAVTNQLAQYVISRGGLCEKLTELPNVLG